MAGLPARTNAEPRLRPSPESMVREAENLTQLRAGGSPPPDERATKHRHEAGNARLPYLPGLDGLRAIAVGAVLLYHAGVSWLPGGFLGVEVFFVISGYLITAILLSEWRETGGIDLRTFWIRRARRLLPALYLLILVALAYAVLRLPGEVARLRGDALAAFAYITNWYFILREQSYFEAIGRPSLLQHLWSLAIEEQYYVIWPPLLALALRRLSQRRVLWGLLAAAGASTLLMALLYRPGVDPSRVYYGTDTRAAGLLLGSALALGWAPWRAVAPPSRAIVAWLDRAGVAALLVLALLFARLGGADPFLYRGGFALIALATATAITGAVAPGARLLPALLDGQPMRWLGERSYSLYLWHWPLFTVTRPELDVPLSGLPLLVLRLAGTVLLADLSYRWVETPIRRGALGRLWARFRALWAAPDPQSWRQAQLWSIGTGAIVGLFLALGITVTAAQAPPPPAEYGDGSVELQVPTAVVAEDPPPAEPAPAEPPSGVATPEPVPLAPSGLPYCPPQVRKPQITAVGDSVMVAGAEEMAAQIGEGLYVNATVSRQALQVPAVLRERRLAGELGSIAIIHAGTNGYTDAEDFEAIMAELTDVRAVIFLNLRVPREWERPNNAVLRAGVARHPKAVLLDWHGTSAGHPEYLKDDGVHPYQIGRVVYGKLIADEVKAIQARWAAEANCALQGPALPYDQARQRPVPAGILGAIFPAVGPARAVRPAQGAA
jgi:peptidoglycan/LPS O-acetylase OafA/YrhL